MTTRSNEITPTDNWPLLIRAQSRMQLKQYTAALADFDAAIALGASEPATRPMRVFLLDATGRDKEAITLQDKSVADKPGDIEARRMRGMLLFEHGSRQDARADLDAVIAKKPTAEELVDRSQLWGPDEKDKRAADLALAVKLDPKSASVRKVLAMDAASAGRFDEADAELATAQRLDPKDAQIEQIRLRNLRLRVIAEVRARKPGASAALAAAVGANPNDVGLMDTQLTFLRDTRSSKEALALADRMVAREPASAQWLNARCWTKATLNIAVESAMADCDAALKLSPASPAILDSRGLARFRAGQFEDALVDYDAALTLRPGMAASLYGRGLTRARLGFAKSAAGDFAAARKANAKIDDEFATYGLATLDTPSSLPIRDSKP